MPYVLPDMERRDVLCPDDLLDGHLGIAVFGPGDGEAIVVKRSIDCAWLALGSLSLHLQAGPCLCPSLTLTVVLSRRCTARSRCRWTRVGRSGGSWWRAMRVFGGEQRSARLANPSTL